jgi:actin-related protein
VQKGLPTMPKNPLLLLAMCAVLSPLAQAQKGEGPAKKLYCWNENGQRVCSDALPADAVNRARDEISAKSGMRTATVERALTEEEKAQAESEAQQRKVDEAAAATRRRTDQAMLASYQSEAELGRVFAERTGIVDNSIRTARYNVVSLREGLVSLLQAAGDRELEGKPVPPEMAANIGQRHRELVRQQQLQASFEKQRVELDAEIADIVQRYRQMKGMEDGKPAATASVEAPVKQ